MSTPLDRHIELIIKYPETSREELKWIYANIHRLKTLDDEVAALRAQTIHRPKSIAMQQQSTKRRSPLLSSPTTKNSCEHARPPASWWTSRRPDEGRKHPRGSLEGGG